MVLAAADSENALIEKTEPETGDFSVPPATELKDFNYESFNNNGGEGEEVPTEEASLFPDFKDGSSDSDSSAILNEDYSSTAAISSPGVLQNQHYHFMAASPSPSPSAAVKFNCSTAALNYWQFQKAYQQTQVYPKMEEHNFFTGEEGCCNFFSEEQAPSLHWWS